MNQDTAASSPSPGHDPLGSPGHAHGHGADAEMDCARALQRLWDYLDGRLPGVTGAQIASHIEECPPCARHFHVERAFLDAVRTLRRHEPGFDALRDRVRAALRNEGLKS